MQRAGNKKFQRFSVLLFLLVSFRISTAQETIPTFTLIESAYQKFEFEQLDSLANLALRSYQSYSKKELIWIHLYLGSAKFAQGFQSAARNQFAAALSLNPDLELDAALFSPKILQLFEEIKLEQRSLKKEPEPASVRYIIQPDHRIDAAWRSLLVPGWGQLYKHEKTKGRIFLMISVLSVSSLAVSQWKMTQTHDSYLKAKEPALIENRYSTYKNWYRARNGVILIGLVNWAYAYFDALLKPIPEQSFSLQVTAGSWPDTPPLFKLTLSF